MSSTNTTDHEITDLLIAWQGGDSGAGSRLIESVEHELRRRAAGYLASERKNHTLSPTALVNEVYVRLVEIERIDWSDRGHFLAMASMLMRRVLVDHARRRRSKKRGGEVIFMAFDESLGLPAQSEEGFLMVNLALQRLGVESPRCEKAVEMRYFGKLKLKEIAHCLEVSLATVKNDLRFARAWLHRELEAAP